jgi:hypothetical protein
MNPDQRSKEPHMLVDSPYCGDWMASAYGPDGKRCDYHLFLNIDGTFQRMQRREPDFELVDHGRWYHKDGDGTMRLESDTPDDIGWNSSEWWVLSVKTCEDSNCLMVLRRVALASRNLPILFYRVHLPGRWYSERLGISG